MPTSITTLSELLKYLDKNIDKTGSEFNRKRSILLDLLEADTPEKANLEINKAEEYTKHHRGKFTDYMKIIAEFGAGNLIIARNFLLGKRAVKEPGASVKLLKLYVVNDDYAAVKKILGMFPAESWSNDNIKQFHEDARVLRKAVKNHNPQMIALLLTYNIPDTKDKHGVNAEALAKGAAGNQPLRRAAKSFHDNTSHAIGPTYAIYIANWFKTAACANVFIQARNNPKIKDYPLLFVIEDYLKLENNRLLNHAEQYFDATFKPKTAHKKFEDKHTQFLEVLHLMATKDNPKEALAAYIAKKFTKSAEKDNSAFRQAMRALAEWDNEALKENFRTYFTVRVSPEYPHPFSWSDQREELAEKIDAHIKPESAPKKDNPLQLK